MAEHRLAGRPASPGIAEGIMAVLNSGRTLGRSAGAPADEAAALRQAITVALSGLQALADQARGDTADMLAFQVAMLSDEELARPAFEAITGGKTADAAWIDAMEAELEGYRASADEYFAARTADLEDIRDRVLAHLAPSAAEIVLPTGAIVVGVDLPLTRFLAIDWTLGGAIVLTQGSPSGHVAMLARARGVPMVVGIGGAPEALAGHVALLDAAAGEVILNPTEATRAAFAARRAALAWSTAAATSWQARPAVTQDGTPIAVHLNIAGPTELDALEPVICDGIGLVRTELLFHGHGNPPDEQTQYLIYRRILAWADGRPVTIRTLDAGGDKPIAGITIDHESNPFLGLRGIRLSLRHPEMFRTQLRALARACVHGPLRIMLPMITVPDELAVARQMLEDAIVSLQRGGTKAARPPLGIMVEVPAAALAIERFDADFFSIGSNDLTQYVTAAARDIGSVADLANPLNPAVLRLIAEVVRHGRDVGRDVSLCGDAGGEPELVSHLLGTGLRSLSVAPATVGRTKQAIAATDLRGACNER